MSGEEIAQLHISKKATGEVVQKIKQLAAENGVSVEIVSENRVAALTRSGQHQGVAADIRAKKMQALSSFLPQRNGRDHETVLLLTKTMNHRSIG